MTSPLHPYRKTAFPRFRSTEEGARCATASTMSQRCYGTMVLLFGFLLCIGSAAAQTETLDESVSCELRVVWGGPISRQYAGQLSIDEGTLNVLRNLSLQPDSIASLQPINRSIINIGPHSPCQFGGVDLRVSGKLTSQLVLTFTDPTTGEPVSSTVVLKDVLQGNWIQPLDQGGTRVAIERQVHDRLRIETSSSQELLYVGGVWQALVSGYRTGVAPGEYELSSTIYSDSNKLSSTQTRRVTLDQAGSFSPIAWEFNAPDVEAAYEVEFTLKRDRFLGNLVQLGPAVSRRTEFIVLDPVRPTPRISGWNPLMSVDVLEAAKPGSSTWLSALAGVSSYVDVAEKWRQYMTSTATAAPPIHHGELGTRDLALPADEIAPCLTISPEGWLALPISGVQPGVPHRLRVRAPRDLPMELSVCVRSADSRGDFPALSPDSALVIDARECSADGTTAVHDLTFWPADEKIFIILANTDRHRAASIVSVDIELAELSAEPSPDRTLDAMLGTQRMAGIYLDKPLLADSLSAPLIVDRLTGRSLCSWRTWFEATQRLEQSMQSTGADTLVLKVYSDGGAIFPSERLDPSRRYDNGTFFSDSRNPDIKDCVELLLRRFDRDGLQLVLALDFDAPLPGLAEQEAKRPSILQRNTLEQAWPTGSASQRGGHRQSRYNPLDQQVQAEFIAAIDEMVQRYAVHPSFAGIALQLDQASQFVFVGDKWGVDPETLAQFAKSTGGRLPSLGQNAPELTGAIRLAFLHWRASEVTKFYAQLSETIRNTRHDAKLYLNAVRLWEDLPDPSEFQNPQAILRNPTEYMMAYGIDPQGLSEVPGVVLMHGSLVRASQQHDSKDWVQGLSSVRGLQSTPSGSTAALIVRQPPGIRLHGLDRLAGTTENPSSQWIFPQASRYGIYARKELIEQLYYADSQLLVSGGWLPVAGQESEVQSLYQTLRQFPAVEMQDIAPVSPHTNLRIRRAKHEGKTFLQFVNNAPWPESVSLQISASRNDPVVRVFGIPEGENSTWMDGTHWGIELPAFSLVGIEVHDADLDVALLQHTANRQAVAGIVRELDELNGVVASAGDPSQQQPLADLGGTFELWSETGRPLGWNVSSLPNVRIARSNELPHSGRSSLMIESSIPSGTAWIQSRAIAPPETGRLAVKAWLRSPAASSAAHVRLSIVGRGANGERFDRSADFGGADLDRGISHDWGRRPAVLHVADIPADLTEIKVAIDLIGPGKIWVDDVTIYELRLNPDERNYLSGQILVAKQKLAENNPYPAERLLASHWGQYLLDQRFVTQSEQLVQEGPVDPPARANAKPGNDTPDVQKSAVQQWRETLRGRWKR